jgi:hypothetical protein
VWRVRPRPSASNRHSSIAPRSGSSPPPTMPSAIAPRLCSVAE